MDNKTDTLTTSQEKIVRLTDKQHANLMTFLMRTDLKGSEVQAFVEIIAALNKQ